MREGILNPNPDQDWAAILIGRPLYVLHDNRNEWTSSSGSSEVTNSGSFPVECVDEVSSRGSAGVPSPDLPGPYRDQTGPDKKQCLL